MFTEIQSNQIRIQKGIFDICNALKLCVNDKREKKTIADENVKIAALVAFVAIRSVHRVMFAATNFI